MACNIIIEQVFGLDQPLDQIRVVGTVEDCAADVEGNSVLVGISCRSEDGPFQERFATVDHKGRWQAIFPGPVPNCECDSEIFVTARCVTEDGCAAEPFTGRIRCVECPIVTFGTDDVALPDVTTECDPDGQRLVSIRVFVINNTQSIVNAVINCGPGGTPVQGGATGFTPNQSGPIEAVCRYDPTVTPNPQPFVEFFNLDFTPQGCPPFPIPVETLEPCEVGCPTSVTLEVRDGDGDIVDPDEVLCLAPGSYAVRVVQPGFPGLSFSWSVDNELQLGETDAEFTLSIGAGQTRNVQVAVTVPDCPSLPGSLTLEGCILECPSELVFEVRNSLGQTVDLDQPCLAAGSYTIVVTVPSGAGWEFQWEIAGAIDTGTIAPEYTLDLGPGGIVPITVTALGEGCPTRSASLQLTGCGDGGDGDDNDGGVFSCDGLLIAAVSALILGGLLIILAMCTGSAPLEAVGAVIVLGGLTLLIIWAIFCRALTSCDVLRKLRCLLSWLAFLALLFGLVMLGMGAAACGLAALITGGGWGGLAVILTDVMVQKGCEIGTCFLPASGRRLDQRDG